MAQLSLEKISRTSYENLVANSKVSATTIYWVDDKTIYVGGGRYGGKVELVTETPTSPEMNTIYVDKSTFVMKIWNGTSFETISKGYTVEITDAATDDLTPTAKAVVNYVAGKVGALPTNVGVTNITSGENGSINVTKDGSDTPETVTINGTVHNPTWDSTTNKLTLPIAGKTALEITFGKDKVVKGGKYNTDTQEIWLTTAEDGTYDDETQIIKIPAAELVDAYTGADTATASVAVSSDNKISVNVKVSAEAGNNLSIKNDGLYVNVPTDSDKMDKITDSVVDEVVIANADGNVKVSGKKIGGESIAAVPNANTLATEKAVQDSINASAATTLSEAKTYADGVASTAETNAKAYADGIVTWVNF